MTDFYADCKHIPNYEQFQTGDILLFSDRKFIPSELIEYFTDSKYSHCAIILRDPVFGSEKLEGLYLLESTAFIDSPDVETGKDASGVQINKLAEVYDSTNGEVYWRSLTIDRGSEFFQIMDKVHVLTYGKSYDYDPVDWVKAYFDIIGPNEQKTNTFVCSALVAFVYDNLGLLTNPVEWTIVRPKDFGTEDPPNQRRVQIINCDLIPEVQIKFNQAPINENVTVHKSIFYRFIDYISGIWRW